MSSFQPFGYEDKPGTCLWCGVRLRFERTIATDADKDNPTYRPADRYRAATVRVAKPGRYWDGLFCGLSCGYQFGARMAGLGHRLEVAGQ